jgi:hypothetical protein
VNDARIKQLLREIARAKGDLHGSIGPLAGNQVSRARTSKKTLADRVDQLERMIDRIGERRRSLYQAAHLAELQAKHPGITDVAVIGCQCAFCRRAESLNARRDKLSDIHARLIEDIIAARLRASRAASKRSSKITDADYERCRAKARSRKELASLLGVTGRGLIGWERRHRKNLAK